MKNKVLDICIDVETHGIIKFCNHLQNRVYKGIHTVRCTDGIIIVFKDAVTFIRSFYSPHITIAQCTIKSNSIEVCDDCIYIETKSKVYCFDWSDSVHVVTIDDYYFMDTNISSNVIKVSEECPLTDSMVDLALAHHPKQNKSTKIFKDLILNNFNISYNTYFRLECPDNLVDKYSDILIKYGKNLTYYNTLENKEFVNEYRKLIPIMFPWYEFVAKLSIDVRKRSTIDNNSKYWNILEVEVSMLYNVTVDDIKKIYKDLLKYIRYYIVKTNVIDKNILPFLKMDNITLTHEKKLVILLSYKNDNKMDI